jgi:hypothetical protein
VLEGYEVNFGTVSHLQILTEWALTTLWLEDFNLSLDLDLLPLIEKWDILQPITKNPATVIDLVNVIPGQTIDSIPDTIPSQITRAYLGLSPTSFALGGTIAAQERARASVPQPYLGELYMDASYSWGDSKNFSLELGVSAGIEQKSSADDPLALFDTSAKLEGSLTYKYNSQKTERTWVLLASLENVHASVLREFFDPESAKQVMPLIDSIELDHLTVDYAYSSAKQSGQKEAVSASYFKIDGTLLVASLRLNLFFEYKNTWTFKATLSSRDDTATIGEVVRGILGDENDFELPDFISNVRFNGADADGEPLVIKVGKDKTGEGDGEVKYYYLSATIRIRALVLKFAQLRCSDWEPTVPPKRLIKFDVPLGDLPKIKHEMIGEISLPLDGMYYLWVQDSSPLQNDKQGNIIGSGLGLTRRDIGMFRTILGDEFIVKDKFKNPGDEDLLVGAGSHFAIIGKGLDGTDTCLLNYDFKKSKLKESASIDGGASVSEANPGGTSSTAASKPDQVNAEDEKNPSAHAPMKKAAGPITISNVGLKYEDKKLRVMFDAIFELGPLSFSLLGFSINLGITTLDNLKNEVPSVSLEGMAAIFDKPPLTIGGVIRRSKTDEMVYYSGGLIVGFVPYQFMAAGFYGKVERKDLKDSFTSIFVFAKLEGPLISFGFAEITGITGGFGYNSDARIPRIEDVVSYPLVAPKSLAGAGDALAVLERLTDPGGDGWFQPLANNYWVAIGMKVDAFQMLSVDAVVLVQFGSTVKLGIFAVAVADIPSSKSPLKFAHVELGMAMTVDLDYGVFKVEAQLAPGSYILHPDCHLSGGCALVYWFDGVHADKSKVGDFVFTLGGYHQAFPVPVGFPNPPRLKISWNLSSFLSVWGEAYFAVTPKVCMGGGRLHASFSAGPIEAWFDAFANFLINYQPFHFIANAKIAVGVKFNIDLLFIHTHISAEVSAELYLWGPPLAGTIHIDIWVTSFDISFGNKRQAVADISLYQFYLLILPASLRAASPLSEKDELAEKPRPENEGHVFTPQSGLLNGSDDPEKKENQPWVVRGGLFSFTVACKMPIGDVEIVTAKDSQGNRQTKPAKLAGETPDIFAKPLRLQRPMSSVLYLEFYQGKGLVPKAKWRMERNIGAVPSGLWGKCKSPSPVLFSRRLPSVSI